MGKKKNHSIDSTTENSFSLPKKIFSRPFCLKKKKKASYNSSSFNSFKSSDVFLDLKDSKLHILEDN